MERGRVVLEETMPAEMHAHRREHLVADTGALFDRQPALQCFLTHLDLGEMTDVERRPALHRVLEDVHVEHGVAEELEALVALAGRVELARVGQGLGEDGPIGEDMAELDLERRRLARRTGRRDDGRDGGGVDALDVGPGLELEAELDRRRHVHGQREGVVERAAGQEGAVDADAEEGLDDVGERLVADRVHVGRQPIALLAGQDGLAVGRRPEPVAERAGLEVGVQVELERREVERRVLDDPQSTDVQLALVRRWHADEQDGRRRPLEPGVAEELEGLRHQIRARSTTHLVLRAEHRGGRHEGDRELRLVEAAVEELVVELADEEEVVEQVDRGRHEVERAQRRGRQGEFRAALGHRQSR